MINFVVSRIIKSSCLGPHARAGSNRTVRQTLLAFCLALATGSAQAAEWWLDNVLIVDGSGEEPFAGAVLIGDNQILEVVPGRAPRGEGQTTLDGGGLVLAPGFIDTHSHADWDLAEHPDATAVISQGITTVVVGQDGGSHIPLLEAFEQWTANPATVNVASYSGHNTLREQVMGSQANGPATDAQIEAMERLLLADLEAGALGFGTGLEYEPGIHSETDEVLRLAKLAADQGGRYISHLRSEDRWFWEAVEEIIAIGRETGMPVQISHIKLAMKSSWGRASELIAKLDAARAEGIDITADIYPYTFWQSNMMVLIPSRDVTDREAFRYALAEIAPPEGFWLTQFEPEPALVGMRLTEIAEQRGLSSVDTYMALAAESLAWEANTGQGADSMIGTSMTEDDIAELFAWPHTNLCTDGGLVDRHPRAVGSFPRVLGRMVREESRMSLNEAVHKMTGLSARHMGFTDRGLIQPGLAADLVLFDPERVMDKATPEDPFALSVGIERVWVNGTPVWENGTETGRRPGRVIRRGSEPP